MKEFIKNHFDFRFYKEVIPAVVCFLIMAPCVLYLPERYGYENGIIENIQMLVLAVSFVMCLKAKNNKKFFIFAALVILFLAVREVNYGRTLFFPIPGKENMFYSWKDIKYGYLVNPLIAVYITGTAIYFFVNKLYLTFFDMLKKIKIPVFNFSLLITGIILGIYAEQTGDNLVMMKDTVTGLIYEEYMQNFVFEEMAELLFYLSLASIIFLYAYRKEKTNNPKIDCNT